MTLEHRIKNARTVIRTIAVDETEVTLLFGILVLVASTSYTLETIPAWRYLLVIALAAAMVLLRWGDSDA